MIDMKVRRFAALAAAAALALGLAEMAQAGATGDTREYLVDRAEVEDTLDFGLVHRLCEPVLVQHLREIDERAGDARSRDAGDQGVVGFGKAAGAMEHKAFPGLAGSRRAHFDGAGVPDQVAVAAGRPMAEQSGSAGGEHGRQLT